MPAENFDTNSETKGQRATELASGLVPFVNVPHSQVEKYMKLQSLDTLSELRDIVRDVKQSPKASKPSAFPEEAGSRSGSQSSRARPFASPKKKVPDIDMMLAKHRRDTGMSWRTSYAQHFGEDELDPDYMACQKAKKHALGQGAFQKIWKPDQQDALNRWKQEAPPQNVQLLADCCRGVFAVEERDQKSSEYKARFQSASDFKYERIERDRNRSEVPIGSIYSTDPWELEASAKRTAANRERMVEICNKQDKLMKKELPKEKMELCFIDRQKMNRYRGSSDVSACFTGITGKATGGSEYRSRFIAH